MTTWLNPNPYRSRRYPTPGWSSRPVFWSYSVAFKKPRSRKLVWVHTRSTDVVEASKEARRLLPGDPEQAGYHEYGISKSYWRDWGGYLEPISSDEYKYGVEHGVAV